MTRKLHIVVLMGGWSAEREVSLTTGNGVADALESRGHRVTRIDMDRDVAQRLAEAKPDVVFNALHGTPGEDGTVQGLMDLMGLKYTHSGLETSVIAIDKELTKLVLVPHGIRMPEGKVIESESLYAADPLPRPYVLKPVNEGSSVGVAIIREGGNHGDPISPETAGPWREFDRLLAEPFIRGRELTVGEHVRPVGKGHRALGPLFDEQDRDPLFADARKRFEDEFHLCGHEDYLSDRTTIVTHQLYRVRSNHD